MNIFKWITGKTGKAALSAMQAVGLSAVVGVAGVAAWQYLDAPADNTAFNPAAQYNPGEVVYVAGASGGSYGANGEVQSSFQAKASKAIQMTEKMTIAQSQAEEFDDSAAIEATGSLNPQAYQMGGTEGLGMAGNKANEEELKRNPMAAAQGSMAGLSDVINRAQAQAQQGAAAGQAAAAAAQKPGEAPAGTLASASRDWGGRSGSGSGGNSFNSTFSVQDSGKNSKEAAAILANPDAVIQNFQNQAAAAREGAEMRARSAFGKDEQLGANRDASVRDGRDSKDGKDLEFIRKRSADAAKNKNRAANEGSRAFLASNRISGGMSVVGDNVTTGQGQGSKDFNAAVDSQLRGIKTWSVGQDDYSNKRDKARKNIRLWMWIALPVALAAMPWLMAMSTLAAALCSNPFTAAIGVALWIKAAILFAIALAPVLTLLGVSVHYMNEFGGAKISSWGTAVAGVLAAGLGTSMIPAVGAALGVLSWNAILATVGGVGLGAGGAAFLNGTVGKGTPEIPQEALQNTNNQ